MKIQQVNNIAFKAYICTDYTIQNHRENFWPKLVDDCRRTGQDKELDELLQQIREDGSKDVLALEKVFPNSHNGGHTYITLGLYDSEDKVVKDRKKTPEAKPKYSINENGIMFEVSKYGRATGAISKNVINNFNSVREAVVYTLKQYLNKDSWIHEQLTSNRLVESKNYLKRFGKF